MGSFEHVILNDIAVEHLFEDQLSTWPLCKENYEALRDVKWRSIPISTNPDGSPLTVLAQFNPARIVSSNAKVDAKTIRNRQCFFCKEGRPAEQKGISFRGVTTDYIVQVNPYPIFKRHLVIQSTTHSRQELDSTRMADMLSLAKTLKNFVLFYNGPNSGASVPDHFHFQAGEKGIMPLQVSFDKIAKDELLRRGPDIQRSTEEKVPARISENYLRIYHVNGYCRGCFVVDAANKKVLISAIGKIYSLLSALTGRGNGRFDPDDVVSSESKHFSEGGKWEPMMNVLCWWEDGIWRCALFARGQLRPNCFYKEGEDRLLIATASVEMSGIFIVPRQQDFDRLTGDDICKMYDDVTISSEIEEKLMRKMRKQPQVSVGIMHADKIDFTFNNEYRLIEKDGINNAKGKVYTGNLSVSLGSKPGTLLLDGQECTELLFEPADKQGLGTFWLRDVVIGVNFHWERKEDQMFEGCLKFIVEHGKCCAINILGVEDYLTSVISSEMSAKASEKLLKAHAVISRSWLLAQMEHSEKVKQPSTSRFFNEKEECEELVKWYDKDDHTNFDVCADDHCQRYQGLTRASTETVKKAIEQTWGEILSYEGHICDARFYKCCGGMLEEFENAWEDTHYDYLEVVRDTEESVQTEVECRAEAEKSNDPSKMRYGKDAATILDLTVEEHAEAWILSSPPALCNTKDNEILSQVLNNYDQETVNFYRWKETYTQEEISKLVREKSGEDFGEIVNLIPLTRGTSGRLTRLKVVGTKKSLIVGKELEIRRILSPSHLYSSAFIVRRYDDKGELMGTSDAVPAKIELIGAGWGHGVGLCQIGAAVMGAKGYEYDAILYHYYPNAEIVKKY